MSKSLKQATASSFLWVVIETFGQRFFKFVFGIILARLLLPNDYGLIGLIAIFVSVARVLINSGFSFALIRQKNVLKIEYTTIFWFNLLVSVFFYFILFFSSSYIAEFYNRPILIPIVKLSSLSLIINSIGIIQNVKIHRELKFKRLAFIHIVAVTISGAVAVYMAYSGFGVWSLVIQQLLFDAIRMILLVFLNRFFPTLNFSFIHFKRLFNFSYKLIIAAIGDSISRNIYPMVIGKAFGIGEVGFYNRAKGLRDMPVLMITKVIQTVTFPAFSKIQDETERFLKAYKESIRISLFLTLYPLLILFISAEPLIEFLLKSKWLPAAPMLQIVLIGSIFRVVSGLNIKIIGIKGRSDLIMVLQFIKNGLMFSGIFVGLLFGLNALLWAIAVYGNLSFILNIYFTSKVVEYKMKRQMKDLLPVLLIAIMTGGLTYILMMFFNGSNLFLIIMQFLFVSLFYFGFAMIFKMKELYLTIDILKRMLKKLYIN